MPDSMALWKCRYIRLLTASQLGVDSLCPVTYRKLVEARRLHRS